MKRAQIIEVLREHGFCEGRCIAYSKTAYCRLNRDHFVVFNAQVFTGKERILKQVDLDLTRDGGDLTAAARAIGQNLYVLYENEPHPFWTPGSTPMREVLRTAVWWSRIHREDQDVFLPVQTVVRRPRRLALVCSVGCWHGHPAYSLRAWENESLRGSNMFGAAIEMRGRPPKGLRCVRERRRLNDAPFIGEASGTRGRPVRPVFWQRSGPFEFIWFSHAQAVPAVLWDNSVGLLERLHFTCHKGHRAIHGRRKGEVVAFIWPCSIAAPEVVASAKARLRRIRKSEAEKAAVLDGH